MSTHDDNVIFFYIKTRPREKNKTGKNIVNCLYKLLLYSLISLCALIHLTGNAF